VGASRVGGGHADEGDGASVFGGGGVTGGGAGDDGVGEARSRRLAGILPQADELINAQMAPI